MEQLTVERVALVALVIIGVVVLVSAARAGLVLPGAGAWLTDYQDPRTNERVEFGPDPYPVINAPAPDNRTQPDEADTGPPIDHFELRRAGRNDTLRRLKSSPS